MSESVILLVEDDPDDAALVMRALREGGIDERVVLAHDGDEALACLHGDSPLPAVVLLDLKLPRLDGHQVLARIRGHERTGTIPVVVLTSSKEESDVMRSYASGVNSFVQKPVNFDSFQEAVRRLAIYWLNVNQPPSNAQVDQ